MKIHHLTALCGFTVAALIAGPLSSSSNASATTEMIAGQPKLLHISATVDGSGRMVFTTRSLRYKHKSWAAPTQVIFDGEPWADLSRSPAAWSDLTGRLDLTKAWIVKREGRDMIAIEHTPDGFDLYLCDSPNGAAHYEVTIAVPRRR